MGIHGLDGWKNDPSLGIFAFEVGLTATSWGITARVFRDLQASDTAEARIVLGAAVIDDVLGLVVLAAAAGIIGAADKGQSVSVVSIGVIALKAAGFLVGAVIVGGFLSPRLFRATLRLKGSGLLLSTALVLCFVSSFHPARDGRLTRARCGLCLPRARPSFSSVAPERVESCPAHVVRLPRAVPVAFARGAARGVGLGGILAVRARSSARRTP